MVNETFLILYRILSVAGVIFLFIGSVGFGVMSVLGIAKILMWWQALAFMIIFLVLVLIGLISFKKGEKYKKLAKKKR
ncbi:hypothetical protein KAJ87_02345 [Candidatus Pacearchaeota archaeon]|nr:hypothetical protein [Candidatus Pacearchaeota archaeon]